MILNTNTYFLRKINTKKFKVPDHKIGPQMCNILENIWIDSQYRTQLNNQYIMNYIIIAQESVIFLKKL